MQVSDWMSFTSSVTLWVDCEAITEGCWLQEKKGANFSKANNSSRNNKRHYAGQLEAASCKLSSHQTLARSMKSRTLLYHFFLSFAFDQCQRVHLWWKRNRNINGDWPIRLIALLANSLICIKLHNFLSSVCGQVQSLGGDFRRNMIHGILCS